MGMRRARVASAAAVAPVEGERASVRKGRNANRGRATRAGLPPDVESVAAGRNPILGNHDLADAAVSDRGRASCTIAISSVRVVRVSLRSKYSREPRLPV